MTSHPHDPHGHDGHPETLHVPPIDPLHDIDGRKTLLWVGFFTATVFISMWLLLHGFGYFLGQEQQIKIWDRETVELNSLRASEAAELQKREDLGDRERISIDEAMRRMAEK